MKYSQQLSGDRTAAATTDNVCSELQRFVEQARSTVNDRMLRLPQVKLKTGRAVSTIWKDVKEGTLPPPISVGPRSVAWRESELQAWIDARVFASRTKCDIDMKAFIKFLTTR